MTNISNRAILVHTNAINNQQRLEAVQFLERLGQRIKAPPLAGWIPACAGMIFFLTVYPSGIPAFAGIPEGLFNRNIVYNQILLLTINTIDIKN